MNVWANPILLPKMCYPILNLWEMYCHGQLSNDNHLSLCDAHCALHSVQSHTNIGYAGGIEFLSPIFSKFNFQMTNHSVYIWCKTTLFLIDI